MDGNECQLSGPSCGVHGHCTFYRTFKYFKKSDEENSRSLSLGEFFFMRISNNFPLCIAELQLLWEDKNTEQILTSVRLYFLPENTPEGRLCEHGEDEILAVSEKMVLRLDDLVTLIEDNVIWARGMLPVCDSMAIANNNGCALLGDSKKSVLANNTQSICQNGLKLDDKNGKNKTNNKDINCKPVPPPPTCRGSNVIILSYPQYCRYRCLSLRFETITDKWLYSILVRAIGGFNVPKETDHVLFCRDTFDSPELDDFELRCDHLAPTLKGHPRKRRNMSMDSSPSPSEDSNDSYTPTPKYNKIVKTTTVMTPSLRCNIQGIKAKIEENKSRQINRNSQIPWNNQITRNNQVTHNNQISRNNQVTHSNQISRNNQLTHSNQISRNNQITRSNRLKRITKVKEEDAFVAMLKKFMSTRQTPIDRIPSLGHKQIDLYCFWRLAMGLGGYEKVTEKRLWKHLYDKLGGNPSNTSAATCTRRHYERLLLPYEKYMRDKKKAVVKHVRKPAATLSHQNMNTAARTNQLSQKETLTVLTGKQPSSVTSHEPEPVCPKSPAVALVKIDPLKHLAKPRKLDLGQENKQMYLKARSKSKTVCQLLEEERHRTDLKSDLSTNQITDSVKFRPILSKSVTDENMNKHSVDQDQIEKSMDSHIPASSAMSVTDSSNSVIVDRTSKSAAHLNVPQPNIEIPKSASKPHTAVTSDSTSVLTMGLEGKSNQFQKEPASPQVKGGMLTYSPVVSPQILTATAALSSSYPVQRLPVTHPLPGSHTTGLLIPPAAHSKASLASSNVAELKPALPSSALLPISHPSSSNQLPVFKHNSQIHSASSAVPPAAHRQSVIQRTQSPQHVHRNNPHMYPPPPEATPAPFRQPQPAHQVQPSTYVKSRTNLLPSGGVNNTPAHSHHRSLLSSSQSASILLPPPPPSHQPSTFAHQHHASSQHIARQSHASSIIPSNNTKRHQQQQQHRRAHEPSSPTYYLAQMRHLASMQTQQRNVSDSFPSALSSSNSRVANLTSVSSNSNNNNSSSSNNSIVDFSQHKQSAIGATKNTDAKHTTSTRHEAQNLLSSTLSPHSVNNILNRNSTKHAVTPQGAVNRLSFPSEHDQTALKSAQSASWEVSARSGKSHRSHRRSSTAPSPVPKVATPTLSPHADRLTSNIQSPSADLLLPHFIPPQLLSGLPISSGAITTSGSNTSIAMSTSTASAASAMLHPAFPMAAASVVQGVHSGMPAMSPISPNQLQKFYQAHLQANAGQLAHAYQQLMQQLPHPQQLPSPSARPSMYLPSVAVLSTSPSQFSPGALQGQKTGSDQ